MGSQAAKARAEPKAAAEETDMGCGMRAAMGWKRPDIMPQPALHPA